MAFCLALVFLLGLPFAISSVYAEDGKRITVDIKNQKLYAWENDQIVLETAVSTGLMQSPTVRGSFKVYKKLETRNMRGVSPVKGRYYLPNVPHVMYFHKAYAIHGAYWHNNFGRRASNGCINLPLDAALQIFNWAPEGTPVNISLQNIKSPFV